MALNQYLSNFFKKTRHYIIMLKPTRSNFLGLNTLTLLSTLLSFMVIFVITSSFLAQKNQENADSLKMISRTNDFTNFSNFLISKISSPYKEINYVIEKNDSIEKILKKFSVKNADVKDISVKLKKQKLANINSGRNLSLIIKKLENGSNTVVNLVFPISNTRSVEVRKSQDEFIIKENILKLYKREVVIKNQITNNLYTSAIEAGIEPNIIVEFARIFGFEVDFQRDIRKGNWFEIYYEKFLDDNDKVRDTGKIIYASMFVNGDELNLYNFNYKGDEEYYDIKGKSITKSLMKTPINGARLSSSFGMRKHPILGYNKMHRGTDFAAPSGTPIMASGSGTVTRARWCGGGGNCVKIKHNSTYETIYAHMKSFAKGVKEGRKVKQGQIIGYVGSTGMSTGPHLHYEVIVNGKKVNSQKLKLPSGKILKGDSRKEFELERIKIDLRLSELR